MGKRLFVLTSVFQTAALSDVDTAKGALFKKTIPQTSGEAYTIDDALQKYNLTLADFWRPALHLLSENGEE